MFDKNKILDIISRFFLLVYMVFVFFYPIFIVFGAFLVWKGSVIFHIFGWLLILLVLYYKIHWISPLCFTRGMQLVKIFNVPLLEGIVCSSIRSPYWLEANNCLLFVPEKQVFFPEYKKVFVVELETQQTYWKPISEVNLTETVKLKSLRTGYVEQQDSLSIYYASPSKEGVRIEFRTVGFSLPILGYYFGFPCGGSYGWEWAKNYFTWERNVIRTASGSVLVELNKIIFNDDELRYYSGGASAWVMEGKFFILEDRFKVFVLGPFDPTTST